MKVTNLVVSPVTEFTSGEKISFDIHHIDVSFANSLRRILLSDIPTLAIDKVVVFSNTSVFFDEMIVHRLALVPLTSSSAPLWNEDDEISFELHITNNTNTNKIITSWDIPTLRYTNNKINGNTEDPTLIIKPVSSPEGIHLFTLAPSQEFHCHCTIKKGVAKVHSKYMAVSTAYMKYINDIHINHDAFNKLGDDIQLQDKWKNWCVHNVLPVSAEGDRVTVKDITQCLPDHVEFISMYMNTDNQINIPFTEEDEPLVLSRPSTDHQGRNSFTFNIESTGQWLAIPLLHLAISIWRSKIERIKQHLEDQQQGKGLYLQLDNALS